MLLSIVMPVYNEKPYLRRIVGRVQAVDLPGWRRQLIIVDDGSNDGGEAIMDRLAGGHGLEGAGKPFDLPIKLIRHRRNKGKGAALRSGLSAAVGEAVLIQDADLEYDPADYPALLEPIAQGRAMVVYGSRFLHGRAGAPPHQWLANRLLSLCAGALFGQRLNDMETCYKVFDRRALAGLELTAKGFEVEPELTAKVLRRGLRIHETPISYQGRRARHGKKIRWTDAFKALAMLLRCRFNSKA